MRSSVQHLLVVSRRRAIKPCSVRLLALAAFAGSFAFVPSPAHLAHAAVITVTSTVGTTGGSDCTLRDAITAANGDVATGGCPAGSGADTINLATDATYTLTDVDNVTVDNGTPLPNGLPSVTSDVTINGNGAIIARSSADGTPPFRLLHVAPNGRLTMNGVTLTNGKLPDIPATQPGPEGDGGGIFNAGVLALVKAVVTANSAGNTAPIAEDASISPSAGCAGRGGGIFNTGTLTIVQGGVSLNRAGSIPGFEGSGVCPGSGGAIYNAAGATATLNGTTINGNDAGDAYNDPNGADGGGIFNAGSLVVTESTISGDGAGGSGDDDGGNGGGIANVAGATATLVDSTVSGNWAGIGECIGGAGGGIFNAGTLTITRCTVSANKPGDGTGGGNGGGIANGGSRSVPIGGTVAVVDSTVSGNDAGSGSSGPGSGGGIFNAGTLLLLSSTVAMNFGGLGGDACAPQGVAGIDNGSGSLVVKNSVAAGNVTDHSCGPPIPSDCGGTLASEGYNLIQYATDSTNCILTGDSTGNLLGVDPHLGPLQDNGGPTQTMALLPGSPAIDAGDPNGCTDADGNILATDQRGAPRAVAGDSRCDMGAYEARAASQNGAAASQAGGGCSMVLAQPAHGKTAMLLIAVAVALCAGKRRQALGRSPTASSPTGVNALVIRSSRTQHTLRWNAGRRGGFD
ncbi:MAG: choice-of-anchor Q domain-containing protein [Candidatus Binatia bacterium]